MWNNRDRHANLLSFSRHCFRSSRDCSFCSWRASNFQETPPVGPSSDRGCPTTPIKEYKNPVGYLASGKRIWTRIRNYSLLGSRRPHVVGFGDNLCLDRCLCWWLSAGIGSNQGEAPRLGRFICGRGTRLFGKCHITTNSSRRRAAARHDSGGRAHKMRCR